MGVCRIYNSAIKYSLTSIYYGFLKINETYAVLEPYTMTNKVGQITSSPIVYTTPVILKYSLDS